MPDGTADIAIWLIDEANNPNGRRSRLRKLLTAAGFRVARLLDDAGDDHTLPADVHAIIGHSKNLASAWVRRAGVPVLHYSGGIVRLPNDADTHLEFAFPREIGRDADAVLPTVEELGELRAWLRGTQDRPAWLVTAPEPIHPLTPLVLLCDGWSALVAATGMTTQVGRELHELGSIGLTTLDGLRSQTERLRNPADWFAPAERALNDAGGLAEVERKLATRRRSLPPNWDAVRKLVAVLADPPASDTLNRLVDEAVVAFRDATDRGFL